MSGYSTWRLPRWLARAVLLALIVATFHLLSWLTGFGVLVRESPAATATLRVAISLFLLAGSLAILVSRDPEFRTRTYRLSAVFALLLATVQVFALVTGVQSLSDLFVPE
jgi:hypothetical protein